MGIFDRAKRIFKANVNAALTKAENPELMLEQIVTEMQQQMAKIRQQVATSIADQKKLEKQWEQHDKDAKLWEDRAKLAIQKGNDELAKQAIERKNQAKELADEFKVQLDKQIDSVDKLKSSLRELELKVEEAKRKKNLLIARQKRAEAQKKMHETMTGMQDGSAFDAFDKMSQKVDDIEAKADAAEELSVDASDKDLESQFKELTSSSIDDELAKLKSEVNTGEAATEVDAELEALKKETKESE
jgi:phage shock protein A